MSDRAQFRRGFVSLTAGVEYLEMPKVACTAIKAALLATDGHDPPRDGNHCHCHRAWDRVPRDWTPQLRFSFVRHPLDRLVSAYVEKLQRGLAARLQGNCPLPVDAPFLEWARWVCRQRPALVDRHWAPQAHLMRRRRMQPDLVGRFERISQDWGQLQADYGLADLAVWNPSAGKRPWPTYYCSESLDLAARFYWEDLERWEYDLPAAIGPKSELTGRTS